MGKSAAEYLSGGHANQIREAVVSKTGRREFKKLGSDLLQGEALVASMRLTKKLRKLGIFIVAVGDEPPLVAVA